MNIHVRLFAIRFVPKRNQIANLIWNVFRYELVPIDIFNRIFEVNENISVAQLSKRFHFFLFLNTEPTPTIFIWRCGHWWSSKSNTVKWHERIPSNNSQVMNKVKYQLAAHFVVCDKIMFLTFVCFEFVSFFSIYFQPPTSCTFFITRGKLNTMICLLYAS